MIRFLVLCALVLAFIWFGSSVPMGKRTLFGHIKAVWATDEAQEMKRGVEEGTKPVLDKVKRGVEAGYREATRDGGGEPARP
jgi:hypothetical protein